MAIYLIRHTTPQIEKGLCYGQLNIDVTESFAEEAAMIKKALPEAAFQQVYSSPLVRCRKLADYLFPDQVVTFEPALMEIHCGEWEGIHWDAIPPEVVDPWMKDFVNVCIPGGESYVQMHARVTECFDRIAQSPADAAIVSHGGVIRSILSHITNTPLKDSFGVFKISYGSVIRVNDDGRYELLHSIATEKEQHKPKNFKTT